MYSTLTDIESVFRSLKGELGLRPVFHQTEFRADGHLFITVLAYQCVQVIRKTLKAQGIHGSWASLLNSMQWCPRPESNRHARYARSGGF